MSKLSDCQHMLQRTEYEEDPDDMCGLVRGLYCCGRKAMHCPLMESSLPKGEQADADQVLEELRRIRGLLEIIVQEVAKESYTHF